MKKEEIDKKFEKLSDINKIRYNLGNIIYLQFSSIFILGILGVIAMGYLFILPLMIRYGGLNRIILMGFMGVFLVILGVVLLMVGVFKLDKIEKSLDEFLNKKSKK